MRLQSDEIRVYLTEIAERVRVPFEQIAASAQMNGDFLEGLYVERLQVLRWIAAANLLGAGIATEEFEKALRSAGDGRAASEQERAQLRRTSESFRLRNRGLIEADPQLPDPAALGRAMEELTLALNVVAQRLETEDVATANQLKGVSERIGEFANRLVAPVRVPAPERLEISLVAATDLGRLEEYQADMNIYLSFAGLLVGAVLGAVLEGVQNDQSIELGTLVLWGILLIGAAVFTALFVRSRMRAKSLKRELLNSPDIYRVPRA